jgi:fermentation-respiration switch protein FrsA (DUF1100 family)
MAFSSATGGAAGAGVSDIFQGFADQTKAKGDYAEAANYNLAADYANQEASFVKQSTAIQEFQQGRELTKSLGQTAADVAGAGFATTGSAIDLLRDSASQGALAKAVLGEQGLIQEQGYKEQAASFESMANAAVIAGGAENKAATGSFIGAGISAATAVATLGTGSAASSMPANYNPNSLSGLY